jgi:hypothetical protein
MSFDVLSEICGRVNLRSDAIERNGDTKVRMKWNNFGVNLLFPDYFCRFFVQLDLIASR